MMLHAREGTRANRDEVSASGSCHELLRHRNLRTTVRYTHVGYERTRHTTEALSRALE
jgi:hypothetical protein